MTKSQLLAAQSLTLDAHHEACASAAKAHAKGDTVGHAHWANEARLLTNLLVRLADRLR